MTTEPVELRIRPFSELPDAGLLWLINSAVFHPRGFALTLHRRGDEIVGWSIQGDGSEPWHFVDHGKSDANFVAAEATFQRAREAAVESSPLIDPNLSRGWWCEVCDFKTGNPHEIQFETFPNVRGKQPPFRKIASHWVPGDQHLVKPVIFDGVRPVDEDSPEGGELFAKLPPWLQVNP